MIIITMNNHLNVLTNGLIYGWLICGYVVHGYIVNEYMLMDQ